MAQKTSSKFCYKDMGISSVQHPIFILWKEQEDIDNNAKPEPRKACRGNEICHLIKHLLFFTSSRQLTEDQFWMILAAEISTRVTHLEQSNSKGAPKTVWIMHTVLGLIPQQNHTSDLNGSRELWNATLVSSNFTNTVGGLVIHDFFSY